MPERKKRALLGGLYLRNLGPILFGALIVGLMNILTPLGFIQAQREYLLHEGGWQMFFLIHPSILLFVGILQRLIQRPVTKSLGTIIVKGKDPDEPDIRIAKKRLLNLPYLLAGISLSIWLIMPGLVVLYFRLYTFLPINAVFLLYFRAFMIGILTSVISFFWIESYLRDKVYLYFFPEGRLADTKGAIRVSFSRRFRVLFGGGTINPMIILVGTLFFTMRNVAVDAISAQELAREVLIFVSFICIVYLIISYRLNNLVSRSIVYPINEMMSAFERIKRGDFTKRIRVVSNDELGVLGDTGNEMIEGLIERDRIRDTFGKYVAPEVRDHILAGRIPFDGNRATVTLLFSDLRNFTPYVEQNDPEEVIMSMRAYFTVMERAIKANRGIVLQYVGDEIEAVFGVPIRYDDHADQAVLAALEMQESLKKLNRARVREGKEPFRHGIGIHTGEVLVGNVGSEDRLSYSMIGDTVNLTSRIESLTKEVGADILIGRQTVLELQSNFRLEEKGTFSVKGVSKAVNVYGLPGK